MQSKFGRQEEMIHLTLTTYLTTTLLNVTPRLEVFDLVPPCFLSCWAACFKLSISRCGRGEQQGRTTESIDIRHRKIWHQSNQRLVSGFFCDSKTGRSNCTQDAPRCMVATQNQHVFQSNFVLVRQHLKWANCILQSIGGIHCGSASRSNASCCDSSAWQSISQAWQTKQCQHGLMDVAGAFGDPPWNTVQKHWLLLETRWINWPPKQL